MKLSEKLFICYVFFFKEKEIFLSVIDLVIKGFMFYILFIKVFENDICLKIFVNIFFLCDKSFCVNL